jgi:uncharacterized ferritin-like protein (DUF455 family)
VTLREFAENLLAATTLEDKLRPAPRDLADGDPGASRRVGAPARPPGLEIQAGGRVRVPPAKAWPDVAQRVRILHALANHELQAAELFAWAIVAFADAPAAVRRGWLRILGDEQRHCRLYLGRLAAHGGRFGEHPVSGHFWRKARDIATPLDFACVMGLTFENANLDFLVEYVAAARSAGDEESARAAQAVHDDEVRHVAFAWEELQRLKPSGAGAWDVYVAHVAPPHGPQRARGVTFDREGRVAAGLPEDFIGRLERTAPERPGGAPRTC